MKIPRMVVERTLDMINYPAAAALLAQTYNAVKINGVDGTTVGLCPGALVEVDSSGNLILSSGSGTKHVIGMLVTSPVPAFNTPSATSGFILQTAQNNNVAVVPLSDSVVEVEAYLTQQESAATALVYAPGDLIYRSTYGFITKHNATQAQAIGEVLEVLASGTLRVQLYRSNVT